MTSKQLSIENSPNYFFSDMINIKNFDPNLLDIRKLSSKTTDSVIYRIKYINHVNIDFKNSLYLIFNNVDGYIEEENSGNKYLIIASVDKNKEVLTKHTEL